MEAHEQELRQQYEKRRSSISGSLGQPPQWFMREGSFKVLSVTLPGEEEMDAFEDKVVNLPDGALVVCHAEMAHYQANAGMCVSCGCILQ
mmetsp:Transcript_108077/g.176607  ORF Transcript_108077/g.176607 Transcript_108077/m.176607 type:complete len:90 (+) Transcript_108077:2-271(+)